MVCSENQLTGFYMLGNAGSLVSICWGTLVVNGLKYSYQNIPNKGKRVRKYPNEVVNISDPGLI